MDVHLLVGAPTTGPAKELMSPLHVPLDSGQDSLEQAQSAAWGFGGLAMLNLFTPQTLDMLTMLGFVILIGTVVNNAILIFLYISCYSVFCS